MSFRFIWKMFSQWVNFRSPYDTTVTHLMSTAPKRFGSPWKSHNWLLGSVNVAKIRVQRIQTGDGERWLKIERCSNVGHRWLILQSSLYFCPLLSLIWWFGMLNDVEYDCSPDQIVTLGYCGLLKKCCIDSTWFANTRRPHTPFQWSRVLVTLISFNESAILVSFHLHCFQDLEKLLALEIKEGGSLTARARNNHFSFWTWKKQQFCIGHVLEWTWINWIVMMDGYLDKARLCFILNYLSLIL